MDNNDYYKILGIKNDADTPTIKKAYKKLAIHYHPDRNQHDKNAAGKMAKLNEAYAVLSNPSKRRDYDLLRQQFGNGAANRFRQNHTYEDILKNSDIEKIFQEIADSFGIRGLNDLFKTGGIQGGGFFFFGTFGGSGQNPSVSGRDFPKKLFHEAGGNLLKNIFTNFLGSPDETMDVYESLEISEAKAREGGPYAYYYKKKNKKLIVKIPPKIHDGHKIRLKGLGIQNPRTGETGDLYLNIKTKAPLLSRIKNFLLK